MSPIHHWRLLTSHEVSSCDQARWIIRLYRQRWIIEPLFRTIKTQGFDIARVLMATAPFRNLCAMTLVASVSCLQLVQDRDGEGQRPLEDVFSPTGRPWKRSRLPLRVGRKGRRTHIRWDPWPLRLGPVLVSGDGTALMENRARLSYYGDCINSGPYNLDIA